MTSIKLIELAEERVAKMMKIVVAHPRLLEAHASMDMMVAHAKHSVGSDKQCMPLIAPSNSGKSTILKSYVTKKNTPEALAEGRIPALHVTLKASVSKKGIVQDILYKLEKFGGHDTNPETGNEGVLIERTLKYLEHASVEILILDEFHHVVLSETEKKANAVGEVVKGMLIEGPCPIVLAGTEKAWQPFKTNEQLVRRAIPPVLLEKLSIARKEDRTVFGKFMGQYFTSMEEQGVATNAKSLILGDVPVELMEASSGIFGTGCKILVESVRIMTRDGRHELFPEDLARATDSLVLSGVCGSNPFRSGARGMQVAA
jgi:hypothetical protein